MSGAQLSVRAGDVGGARVALARLIQLDLRGLELGPGRAQVGLLRPILERREGGLAVIGAGLGIGMIGRGATEGMARQPEIAGSIQTAGLILAAFVEGADGWRRDRYSPKRAGA